LNIDITRSLLELPVFQLCLPRYGNDSSSHMPWSGSPAGLVSSQTQTGSFCSKMPQNMLHGHVPAICHKAVHGKQSLPAIEPHMKPQHSSAVRSAPGVQPRYCLQASLPAHYIQSQANYDSMSSFSEGSDYMASNEKTSKNKVLPNEVSSQQHFTAVFIQKLLQYELKIVYKQASLMILKG
jgi:hypothetical protein